MVRFSARRLLQACLTLSAVFLLFTATPARAQQDFLDPAVAFRFEARMADPQTAEITYVIAPAYYMYRERFAFKANGAGVTLGEPQIPQGKVKYDPTFEKDLETHTGTLTIRIPVEGAGPFTLTATSQGCADAGLCYPPQEHSVNLGAGGAQAASGLPIGIGAGQAPLSSQPMADRAPATTAAAPAPAPAPASDLSNIAGILGGGSLLAIVPAFILLGLGLAFTPCVLPMVPILSSIIVGEGKHVSRSRGFVLSLAYSLGMAIVYTLLGIAAGLAGEGLAAALQNPWVLGAFATLIVAMSLSMFGFYQLQLPNTLQTRLTQASNSQQGGKLLGVFVMGAISALIVGPCVAAPLAGALVYISQTRDVFIGGAALFSMAVGMSIPLLLVGLSAGSLLPRVGPWMESVKRLFGVLMLAMAIWLVSPVIPAVAQMLLWAALLLGYGFYLLRHTRHWAAMAFGAAFAVLGATQLVGLASGGRDAWAPLAHLGGAPQDHGLAFSRVNTVDQLDAALAANAGKTVMLDFYADWCVSCKEMEKLTFVDPAVQQKLADTVLLQVDVTANDADDKAMLKRFGLFGPPGIILFDGQGKEIADSRVIGFQNAEKFLNSLQKLGR
ncbi:protein-disulfide reductase DsbD [Massilia sp. CFBP9012]|uniref:protein-disulfide reductase DsbD n=1 Tax=Massilia sp. CFBP9012 TaxID=3096531 RepID=UPI002A6A91A1|nr:protein-disulfide reductase DsbD [Massilia sp. CFBP9012]MDY0974651.1 protein-disulfide reductase DsbD [Massilia sp. CFBP9012]